MFHLHLPSTSESESYLDLQGGAIVSRTNGGNGPARLSLFGVHAPAFDRALALTLACNANLIKPMVKPIEAQGEGEGI